ncbi:MAG: hypothetical protein V4482_03905 [Pseudomonadota bacterium]
MRTVMYQQTITPPLLVPDFDAPKWTFGHSDGLTVPDLEEFHFPDRVIIVGTLKPYYAELGTTGCYFNNSGTVFSPVSLYGEPALARIEWVADWIEHADGGIEAGMSEAMEKPLIWGMDFMTQDKNLMTGYMLPNAEHSGFWQATQSMIEPVWSWGGMYHGACALADIKPRYFSLLPGVVQNVGGRKTADTKIEWVSSINPRYQRLLGSFGGDVSDEESAAAIFQPMSLLNHIQFGSITYSMPNVTDAVGYQSADVLDYDAQNGRVKLLFLRRKHGDIVKQH